MLASGKFPQATKVGQGWSIPLGDLLAAGLTPGVSKPEQAPVREHDQDTDQAMTGLTHELELLRVRLLAAQALADERGRTIDQMQTTMRALEARQTDTMATDTDGPLTRVARRFRL